MPLWFHCFRMFRRSKDPADQLLRVWKTDNVTIGDLIRCLKDAELLRQAAYVSQILQPTETVLVEVPVQGKSKPRAVMWNKENCGG